MFCPKCGAENHETNQYCRACRENLQVISQAMKNRLPVVIASKVDQILDSRSERFRRDSLLKLLMSLTALIGCIVYWETGQVEYRFEIWLYLFIAVTSAWDAFSEYRAYKRSLSPDFDWTTRDEDDVDSLAYRLGRAGGHISQLLQKGLANVPFISLKPARSTTNLEGLTEASAADLFSGVSIPSVTESTTRELDPSSARSRHQSEVIYCPRCGRAGDRANRCGACDVNLDLVAIALRPPEQDPQTAKLDRYIRKKTNGLAAASQSFSPILACFLLAIAILMIATSRSTPQWWWNLGFAVFLLVSGAWDRIAYRRNHPEQRSPQQRSTVQITDADLRINLAPPPANSDDWEHFSQDGRILRINDVAPAINAESRPIRELQQRYPNLWMLIEVTSDDERGASEGRLIATAEDYAEFDELEIAKSDRYLLAIYGKR